VNYGEGVTTSDLEAEIRAVSFEELWSNPTSELSYLLPHFVKLISHHVDIFS
jgi:hypothetical protein